MAALHKKTEPKSARQVRQLAAIAKMTSDIRHVDGKNNLVADALSRPDNVPSPTQSKSASVSEEESMPPLVSFPVCHNCQGAKLNNEELRPTVRTVRCQSNNTLRMGVDYQQFARDQQSDPEVQAYKTAATSLKIQDVPWADGQFTVLCDTSLGTTRPIVPSN